jgi:hypothetical protein
MEYDNNHFIIASRAYSLQSQVDPGIILNITQSLNMNSVLGPPQQSLSRSST